MRKILLVVAAVMCMGGAFAQLSMGPKLGLNVSSLTGDGSNFRAGVNVGIFANYRINKLLAIQPEFYYSMQGAGFDDIPVLTKTLESNYTSYTCFVENLSVGRFECSFWSSIRLLCR